MQVRFMSRLVVGVWKTYNVNVGALQAKDDVVGEWLDKTSRQRWRADLSSAKAATCFAFRVKAFGHACQMQLGTG
jgi:hypothetical protein